MSDPVYVLREYLGDGHGLTRQRRWRGFSGNASGNDSAPGNGEGVDHSDEIIECRPLGTGHGRDYSICGEAPLGFGSGWSDVIHDEALCLENGAGGYG